MTTQFVNLLDALRRRALAMASLVEDMLREACEALVSRDEVLAARVIARDSDVDAEEVQVEAEVIRLLALYQPVGSDLRLLCSILKVNNDLERVADCAVNMGERIRHLGPEFSILHHRPLLQLCTLARQILRGAVQAYATEDAAKAVDVAGEDDAVDALYCQFIRELIAEASSRPEQMATHVDILSVAKNLERIADHATNIAEDVIFLHTGKIVRHQPFRRTEPGRGPPAPTPRRSPPQAGSGP